MDLVTKKRISLKIKKILYSAGFVKDCDNKIVEICIDYLYKIIKEIFSLEIHSRIQLMKKKTKKESKFLLNYFSFVWDIEFYSFSDRFRE